jgi:hypothetical protein
MHIGYLGAFLGGMAAAGTAVAMGVSLGLDGVSPPRDAATVVPIERAARSAVQMHGPASSSVVTSGLETSSIGSERNVTASDKRRDPAEWQGMSVDYRLVPCSDEGFCQRALACIDGSCDACSSADDCQVGEVCAVEHCVLAKLAKCTSYRDCPNGEVCVLSGYSDDLRGNGAMEAACSGSLPSREPVRVEYPPEAYLPNPSPLGRLADALLAAPK